MKILQLPINLSRHDPGRREKLNLNFYVHSSLWSLKRVYKGLKGLHNTFRGTAKKCKNKNFKLISILIQFSEIHRAGKVNIT